jgi:very-short-patch-repair endonuclease
MNKVVRARELRKSMTRAEVFLWERLKNRRLGGWKFRRQHPLGEYVVGFVCLKARLVVELDGCCHDFRDARDWRRTQWLRTQGYRVLRLANEEVFSDEPAALRRIRVALEAHVGGRGKRGQI